MPHVGHSLGIPELLVVFAVVIVIYGLFQSGFIGRGRR